MSVTDIPPAPAVVSINRWRRFGYDRAYVRVGDSDVGYRDLVSGEVVCARPTDDGVIRTSTDTLLEQVRRRAAEPRPAITPDGVVGFAAPQPGEPIYRGVAEQLGISTDERASHLGAEQAVGAFLAGLGPRWRVVHAIPAGNGRDSIDHVVIGPAGVFTVNTKHHPGAHVRVNDDAVVVNGCPTRYVRSGRSEAKRAAYLLTAQALFDVEVRGVVAVLGARALTVEDAPHDVDVVEAHDVVTYLRSQPETLGQPSIERIVEAARLLAA